MNKYTFRKHAVKSLIWAVIIASGFMAFKAVLTMNTVETLAGAAILYFSLFADSAFEDFIGDTAE